VLREGLKALLGTHPEWEVVAEANDGFEGLPLIEEFAPDVLILDLSMPNLGGIETITRLRKLKHDTRVLVLSARDDQRSVREVMKAGASGYVTKSATTDELEFALGAVIRGQTYLSPAVCGAVLSSGEDGEDGDASPLSVLSGREREVMKLLAQGEPNRDVAKMLHISPRTVDSHRANIMKKLGVSSNAELVKIAIKAGMLD